MVFPYIIIFIFDAVIAPEDWSNVSDIRMIERVMLRSSLDEIYDLQWSPDSEYVLAGAIDAKVTKRIHI